MKRLQVFDPAMCCSTGVCGPSVDSALPQFAADLAWLQGQGVEVVRYNLAQQPQAFADNELVRQELTEHGSGCLPLVVVDGQVVSRSVYPTRDHLAAAASLPTAKALDLPVIKSGCCGSATAADDAQAIASRCC
jgi:arsenite methyltransferase